MLCQFLLYISRIRKSAICLCISLPSWTSHPSRSSQSIKLSSLCYTAGYYQLFILHMVVYLCFYVDWKSYKLSQSSVSGEMIVESNANSLGHCFLDFLFLPVLSSLHCSLPLAPLPYQNLSIWPFFSLKFSVQFKNSAESELSLNKLEPMFFCDCHTKLDKVSIFCLWYK